SVPARVEPGRSDAGGDRERLRTRGAGAGGTRPGAAVSPIGKRATSGEVHHDHDTSRDQGSLTDPIAHLPRPVCSKFAMGGQPPPGDRRFAGPPGAWVLVSASRVAD